MGRLTKTHRPIRFGGSGLIASVLLGPTTTSLPRGYSIDAAHVVGRVRALGGRKIDLASMFEFPGRRDFVNAILSRPLEPPLR